MAKFEAICLIVSDNEIVFHSVPKATTVQNEWSNLKKKTHKINALALIHPVWPGYSGEVKGLHADGK